MRDLPMSKKKKWTLEPYWKLNLHIGVFWSHMDVYEDGKTERMLYRL